MKSNQERSNGCLPPKKREILALEQRPLVVAPPADPVPHAENLAWLASVASERCKSRDSERCPPSAAAVTSSPAPLGSPLPLASLPVFPAALQQHTGTIQFTQLGPNVQLISSGPYAGYISSHVVSGNASALPAGQRPQLDGYTALLSPPSKGEQQGQVGPELTPASLPNSPQVSSQFIHLDSRAPLTVGGAAVTSSAGHLQIHPHAAVIPQTLTLAPPQLLVQYADGPAGKKADAKAAFNGELEVKHPKGSGPYEARHILLPAEYGQTPSGLQTSLVLVAQQSPATDPEPPPNKVSLLQTDKSVCLGKAAQRTFTFSPPPEVKAPGAVVHAAHEELASGLFSSQPPIIGYITSGSQHAVSYHAALPQHLVIPSGQSLLIPVTSTGSEAEVGRPAGPLTASSAPQISTAMPHAYLATALSKCEALAPDPAPAPGPPPAAPAPASSPSPAPVPPSSPSVSSPPSPVPLPPFFMRGSIIQLADGELKRVEDLKTEDFIQSAEISDELKIDSSTVERIDSGQSPNAVVIQFSVGELKAQVCVEVLVEYPFFVFGQGWSSCCPDRTTQLFELSCAKLCVGDVCVSLTLRGLRNGAVTDHQTLGTKLSDACHNMETALRTGSRPGAAGSTSGPPAKTHSALCRPETASGPESGAKRTHSGPGQDSTSAPAHEARHQVQRGGPDRVRKRRWSAPERDQTEKVEGEPPPSLAKPSVIPQEVKISIEGHSSTGAQTCHDC